MADNFIVFEFYCICMIMHLRNCSTAVGRKFNGIVN